MKMNLFITRTHFTLINKIIKSDFGSEVDDWNQEYDNYDFAIKNIEVPTDENQNGILIRCIFGKLAPTTT